MKRQPWEDIGFDLAQDEHAPESDPELYAYLTRRVRFDGLVDEAWFAYLSARS